MKTGPQHLLAAHVPFYRRRWFWILMSTALFSLNIIIIFLFTGGIRNILVALGSMIFAAGGGLYWFIFEYLGMTQSMKAALYVYTPILTWQLFYTFKIKDSVAWIYLLLIHMSLTTTFLVYQYLTFSGPY
jgi:hypothetical protein